MRRPVFRRLKYVMRIEAPSPISSERTAERSRIQRRAARTNHPRARSLDPARSPEDHPPVSRLKTLVRRTGDSTSIYAGISLIRACVLYVATLS